MTMQKVQANGVIANTPEAVLGYVADVRNRTFFLPSLKAITNIKGEPASANTTWTWTWVLLGMEFVGTGRSVAYQPGKMCSFKTEGGIESTWTYTVAPEGRGTRLTIQVEYEPPTGVLARVRGDAQTRHQAEVDHVLQNLKTILDEARP
jgi:carbon monoxide dehydrogenase subunit G